MYPRIGQSSAGRHLSPVDPTVRLSRPSSVTIDGVIINDFNPDDDQFTGWALTHIRTDRGMTTIHNCRFVLWAAANFHADVLISELFNHVTCDESREELADLRSVNPGQEFDTTFMIGSVEHQISIYNVDPSLI